MAERIAFRGLWLVAATTAAVGCAAIAGLDEEFIVGSSGEGGTASGATTTGTTPTGAGTETGTGTGAAVGGSNTGTAVDGAGGGTGATGGGTVTGTGTGTGSGTGTGTGSGTGTGTGTGTGITASFPCGAQTCTGDQICCVAPYGSFQGCTSGTCSSGQFDIQCDGVEDCGPGEVCCANWNVNYLWIRCVTSCDAPPHYIQCGGEGSPNPQNCVWGTCNADVNLPPYRWCGG